MGCFPGGASVYGVEDLSGNVWEWTRSHWKNYPYKSNDGREDLAAGSDVPRVLRGGSFDDDGGLRPLRLPRSDRPPVRPQQFHRVSGGGGVPIFLLL